MADQQFIQEHNRFWIDLHKCATFEAVETVTARIKECYKYGIENLEIIYGTPDVYKGSIQEAANEIVKNNSYIYEADEFPAGINIKIKKNPDASLQDENMCFSGFAGSYENWHRTMEHTYNYYPLRKSFTTSEISKDINCPVEYVRNVANNLENDYAEIKTVYNQYNRRDETTWYIFKSGYEFIQSKWQEDKHLLHEELKKLEASDSEIESVLNSFKTPLKSGQKVKSRASAALKRVRAKSVK
jgi:hypothetical protein